MPLIDSRVEVRPSCILFWLEHFFTESTKRKPQVLVVLPVDITRVAIVGNQFGHSRLALANLFRLSNPILVAQRSEHHHCVRAWLRSSPSWWHRACSPFAVPFLGLFLWPCGRGFARTRNSSPHSFDAGSVVRFASCPIPGPRAFTRRSRGCWRASVSRRQFFPLCIVTSQVALLPHTLVPFFSLHLLRHLFPRALVCYGKRLVNSRQACSPVLYTRTYLRLLHLPLCLWSRATSS